MDKVKMLSFGGICCILSILVRPFTAIVVWILSLLFLIAGVGILVFVIRSMVLKQTQEEFEKDCKLWEKVPIIGEFVLTFSKK